MTAPSAGCSTSKASTASKTRSDFVSTSGPAFAGPLFFYAQHASHLRSESLQSSPIGAKDSEAQGRDREVASGGSAEQNHGSMNKNRLIKREERTSGQMAAKSTPIKARQRKDGDRVAKGVRLIWGDLCRAPVQTGAGPAMRRADRCTEVSKGRSSDEGRETGWSEGPNGAPEWAEARGGRVTCTLP